MLARAALLAIAPLLFTPGASAQVAVAEPSADDAARARELFEQGVALSAEERWSEALERFRASRALSVRPSTVYNIATTLQRLGRAVEAIDAVREYLEISDPVAHASQRAQAEQLRELLYSTLVRVTFVIAPETAELSVDGRVVPSLGAEREVVLDPGDHAIAASAAGHVTARVQVSLGPGTRERRQIVLERLPEQPAHLIVRTSPADAEVAVDGAEVGVGDGDVAVTAGRHVVRVRADRHRELRRIVVVGPGERLEIDASLERSDGSRSVLDEPAFWIVAAAIAAVAAGAGVTAGVLASDAPYEGSAGFTVEALRF